MLHEIKIQLDYFADINKGDKQFELRKDDRNYRVGDYLWLRAIDNNGDYAGPELVVLIKYKLSNYVGLLEGFCILGLEVCYKWRIK